MRTVLATLVLAIIAPLAVIADEAPTQKDVTAWINEAVARDTTDARRGELGVKLYSVDRLLMQKPVKAAIEDEKTRSMALKVGAYFKVPGLFETAKKFISTDDEELIVHLAVRTLDKGAGQWAYERWKVHGVDTASFSFCQAAFVAYSVPMEVFQNFKTYIAAKDAVAEKRDKAATILGVQLGVEDITRPDEFLAKWTDLKAAYDADAKAFRIVGTDVLTMPGAEIGGKTIKVGNNLRMNAGANLKIPAAENWHKGSFTLTARILVKKGSNAEIWLYADQGGWFAKLSDGDWVVKTGAKVDLIAKSKPGEWATIVWTVTDLSKPNTRYERDCTMTIDGTVVLNAGALNGRFQFFAVKTGDADIVVGGVDFKSSK